MQISAPYIEEKYQNINNKLSSVIMEHPLYKLLEYCQNLSKKSIKLQENIFIIFFNQ